MSEISLKPEQYLLREGEESHEMYFVKSGTMAVFKIKNNSEQQIGTIYAGELVGEMSFLDGKPRSASVRAISECELVVIPQEKLESVIKKQPNWYQALVKTLVDRLRRANCRIKI